MDPGILRPESHVAQQSRRDKLRFQQSLNPLPHFDNYTGNLDRFSVQPGLHQSLVQVRNVGDDVTLYDPTAFNSEMLHFATSSSSIVRQELGAVQTNRPIIPAEDSSFTAMSSLNDSPKASIGDPQGSGNWRGLDSTQGYDCMVSYARSVAGARNQKSVFVGDVSSSNERVSSINPPSVSAQYLKHSGYQDVHLQTSLGNPSCGLTGHGSQKREMPFMSHSLYQNSLQDVVTSDAIVGNDHLLSSYGDQLATLPYDNASNAWLSIPTENFNQFRAERGLVARNSDQELRNIAVDANAQGGLSLSLSSNPLRKVGVTQFGERYEAQHFPLKNSIAKESEDSKFAISNYLAPMPKPSITSKECAKSLDDVAGTSTQTLRNTGPLGPFTGYATILKSSIFLKPAQELLDEFCTVASPKLVRPCELSEMTSGELSTPSSANAANAPADDTKSGVHCENNSGISSSTFYSSNEGSIGCRAGNSSCEPCRPENLQKKARLLYLQEEVCRRYRQYQQQMQMVASSFESVAGLSAATPYISLALKAVSRNFRSLKQAISDQLKHITKALGEDMLSTNTNTNYGKGEMSLSRLRYNMDHSFQKYKSDRGTSVGFLEPQQHIWRPQRGLPERSVAILRAWLFEHFLHPYPTDADKHMLATQTGLSRNQVSNWFINARVRVWKPMVEEIHMLETKCLSETNQNSRKKDGNYPEGCSLINGDQSSSKFGANFIPNRHLECSGTSSSLLHEEQPDADQWNQEKRSRVEFQVPSSIDGSLMNFVPFQRNGFDGGGGHGAVSLTLGLQHGVENAQQHRQQLQEHENQLGRQFGGPMIHDFED